MLPSENENFSNSENISDPLVFQSKLASFIISSKLPRSNATKLLILLKSVNNLQCLQSLPTDSRTLLSTPRSGLVDITNIGAWRWKIYSFWNNISWIITCVKKYCLCLKYKCIRIVVQYWSSC